MRALFIMVFAACIALTLGSLAILPPIVAIHFGTGGVPNGWASSTVNALLFLGLQSLLFFMFLLAPRLVFLFPPSMVNLPNKDYWLKEENKPRTEALLTALMYKFGVAMLLFFFVVNVLVIHANLTSPVRLAEVPFLAAVGLLLLYTAYWCVKLYQAFRLPPGANAAGQLGDKPSGSE